MSSYLYASSTAQSINGEEYEVRIIENTSGTDSTKEFDVGPQGVKLIYENTDDTLLLPGIVHSRCEVETLWPSGDATLSTLLTNLLSAQDGDWLLEVLRDSERIWVGTILCDEAQLLESSPIQTFRLVATDGLSLLKNVDYNDNGTAYTGDQIIWDDILTNIQEKWTTWSYLNDQNSTAIRLEMADDVYSTDDYVMALKAHPGGTLYLNTRRMRIHSHAFRQGQAGGDVFISCYDLLLSICLTLQLRLYYYGNTWSFIPAYLSDQEITGYQLTYSGGTSAATIVGTFEYQQTATNNIRQKGNEWVQSFTPQINKVNLTRDTNNGYHIIAAYYFNSGVTQSQTSIPFESASGASDDEGYYVQFQCYVENSAITKADDEILGRIVVEFEIKFDTGADAIYYSNEIVPHPAGRVSSFSVNDTQFSDQDYAPFTFPLTGYTATQSSYYYHDSERLASYNYDMTLDGSRYIEGTLTLPPPTTQKTGVTITPTVKAYDSFGIYDATATAALTSQFVRMFFTAYSNDANKVVPNFTWQATTTFGRGEVNLGTTNIGGLGIGMGSIQVATSASN